MNYDEPYEFVDYKTQLLSNEWREKREQDLKVVGQEHPLKVISIIVMIKNQR